MRLDIIQKAVDKFSQEGGKATHIIFPIPKGQTWLTIGNKRFKIQEGQEMGMVLGMKIYVDRKAKEVYIIDSSTAQSLIHDELCLPQDKKTFDVYQATVNITVPYLNTLVNDDVKKVLEHALKRMLLIINSGSTEIIEFKTWAIAAEKEE